MDYIKNISPIPRMEHIVNSYATHVMNLDVERFCYRNTISEEILVNIKNNANISSLFDDITRSMIIQLETKMAFKPITSIVISGYEIPTIKYKAINEKVFYSVWELFKHKFFPKFLKKWFPPKYQHIVQKPCHQRHKKINDTTVYIKDYYPSVNLPKHRAFTCIDIPDVDLGKSHIKVIEDPAKLKAKDNYRHIKSLVNDALKTNEEEYMVGRQKYYLEQIKELL